MRPENLRAYGLAVGLAAVAVASDVWTKRYAATHFVGRRVVIVPKVLAFTYGENSGAAFSMFPDGGAFLGVAAMVATGFVLYSLRNRRPMLEVAGLGLIMGGALGNLVDRLVRGDGFLDGHVVDWIQFPNFPIFNLADTWITVGVGLLFIAGWRHRPA